LTLFLRYDAVFVVNVEKVKATYSLELGNSLSTHPRPSSRLSTKTMNRSSRIASVPRHML